ncbi:pentapeptide repeat-containing protein [Fortiea sp. LEGE XX443]|nr:pentapeptide repeat-containing protein [Fortiea sp. LEGE XX443]
MFAHILNACNPVITHSINSNVILYVIHEIVYSQEKKHLMMAVQQLHSPTIDTRLEGIIKLENLGKTHPKYTWEIIEILTTFVRINSPCKTYEEVKDIVSLKIHPDIQASLSVISRSDSQQYVEYKQIDLSHTDLRKTNLCEANLAGANLYQVNLSGANLSGANLSGAILSAANLSEANLASANLSGAILSAANLSEANLSKANLMKANLYLANLSQANLQDAIFDGANLREVKFSGQETTDVE